MNHNSHKHISGTAASKRLKATVHPAGTKLRRRAARSHLGLNNAPGGVVGATFREMTAEKNRIALSVKAIKKHASREAAEAWVHDEALSRILS